MKALTPVSRPAGGLSHAVGKPATPGSTLASRHGSHARDSGRLAVTPVTPAAAARAEVASRGEETVPPRQLGCGSGSWRFSDFFAQSYISKQCCGSGSASFW